MTYSHRILPIAGGQQPSFRIASAVPDFTVLNPSLTINGATETPMFRYRGSDATVSAWPAWTYGQDLEITGSGAAPNVGQYSPLNETAAGPSAKSGKYWQAGNSTFADVTTHDLVFEAIVKSPTTTTALIPAVILSKRLTGSGPTDVGYSIYFNANQIYYVCMDGDGVYHYAYSSTLPLETWYHVMIFHDSGSDAAIYINGAVDYTSADISSCGSQTNAAALMIGAWPVPATNWQFDGLAAYIACWAKTTWLDTHLQATVAKERAARVMGIWPNKAGTSAPTTMTRSTTASLERYVSSGVKRIFTVGANWIRTVQKTDTADQVVSGILIESQKKNEFTYSQDFNNAAWTKTRCSVSNNGATAPDGTATADGLIGDANDNTHMFEQALTPDSGDQVFSVFLKAGALSWARLDILQDANCYQYFDLATSALGASGTSANLIDKGIENFGSGWRRCWIRYSGIPGAHDHHIHACPANNDQTYAGDGATVDLWVWGAQHEPDSGAPTSYTYTAAAAVTKTADSLKYSTTSNIAVGEGALETSTVIEDQDTPTQKTIVAISNAGSATQKFQIDVDTSNKSHCSSIVSTVVASIVGTQNWCNGLKRKLMSQWETNDIRLYNDGVEVSSRDTSCTVAASMTVIDVGQDSSGANQLDGIIADIKFYRKPLKG